MGKKFIDFLKEQCIFYQVWLGGWRNLGETCPKKYSFKGGGRKRYVCKVGRGITNKTISWSFVMMASATINTFRQNTAKTSLRFKTINLFPGNRPPPPPDSRILLSTQQQLLYPTNSYFMVVKYSQQVKQRDINSFPIFLEGGGGCLLEFWLNNRYIFPFRMQKISPKDLSILIIFWEKIDALPESVLLIQWFDRTSLNHRE